MHFSTILGAVSGLASLAVAAPATELSSRGAPLTCGASTSLLSAADCKVLSALGVQNIGKNAGGTVVGTKGGPNTWTVTNRSNKDIVLVAWGPAASWINANTPDVTYTLAPNANVQLSTPNGYSGAMSAIYGSETKLVNGQVANTWLEFTTGDWGVINVSREVNTHGNTVTGTITSSTGQKCTSDFTKCFFSCANGGASCWQPFNQQSNPTGYQLYNCKAGSQPGAQTGTYAGGDSGGCGGFGPAGAHVDVTFS